MWADISLPIVGFAKHNCGAHGDALDYLLKARPEAMGHYFRFAAEAGKHLDAKTRALISVITKVHAQTDAGFRQYLKRALKSGASPNEVLDALLMAFPALGLTKIVWAIDILLKLDLPESACVSRCSRLAQRWQARRIRIEP